MAGVVLVTLAAAAWGALQWRSGEARARGAALYAGQAPLAGRLTGHEETLPPLATRCANCHEGATALGGALSAARLTVAQPRRGGPPTAYTAAALCELLRTGIDPARVVIAASMPRYELTDLQCKELWTYLTTS